MNHDGHPYLSGVLLAMTRNLLERMEQCEDHDSRFVSQYRAELNSIDSILSSCPGWTEDDIRAIVRGPVPA